MTRRGYCVECGLRFLLVHEHGGDVTEDDVRWMVDEGACPECWGPVDVLAPDPLYDGTPAL